MAYHKNWAIVVPMANEEADFQPFIETVHIAISELGSGKVYLIVDNASRDRTLELCREVSAKDSRYVTVFAPKNRNLVDAYVKGLTVAYSRGHDAVIEMDAGLSHDPRAIPIFLSALSEGNECVFGSRTIRGGSMGNSPLQRRMLSRIGTLLANLLLGTTLYDMTSGYQGFSRDVVGRIIQYDLRSKAHFYQTELRYLLRNRRICEVPIHYTSPSPRVSKLAIQNAYQTLFYYFFLRLIGKTKEL